MPIVHSVFFNELVYRFGKIEAQKILAINTVQIFFNTFAMCKKSAGRLLQVVAGCWETETSPDCFYLIDCFY